MADLFLTADDLGEYVFRIVDNGGATADRYTILFSDGDALYLSGCPSHPQGVSLWAEGIDPKVLQDEVDANTAVDLGWGDLPENIRGHILARCNQGWKDYLERCEGGEAIAKTRDAAEVNEGINTSAGKGIYQDQSGKYWVRLDGAQEDDRGPKDTPREALLATLPDHYGLAGPEYHSTALSSVRSDAQPSDEVAKSIADLEARVEAEDNQPSAFF